jgi:hypothetical protein
VKGTTKFAFGSAVLMCALAPIPASAQTQINARISGNCRVNGGGKCTFEVVVQGRAEVQIRGGEGRLVTDAGAPATWRRLDCSAPLPYNPTGFRFSGVDGHGQQNLAADPNSNNGVAVVTIDNGNHGNNEGYTGDITWSGGNGSYGNSNYGNPGWGNNGGWQGGHDGNGDNSSSGWQNGNSGWNRNSKNGWGNNGGWNNNGNNGNWGNTNSAPKFITARISGNSGGSGKCTFEVAVQGRAQVEVRGDQGRLISEDGRPATWRRLDCNQPLPRNPGNFRFNGVDGHGRQSLAADPSSNNGVAVILIDNGTHNNNEGYTGDLTWR